VDLNEQNPRVGNRNQVREDYTSYEPIETANTPPQYHHPRNHERQRGNLTHHHASHEVSTKVRLQ
jgi:hypothetical protein